MRKSYAEKYRKQKRQIHVHKETYSHTKETYLHTKREELNAQFLCGEVQKETF